MRHSLKRKPVSGFVDLDVHLDKIMDWCLSVRRALNFEMVISAVWIGGHLKKGVLCFRKDNCRNVKGCGELWKVIFEGHELFLEERVHYQSLNKAYFPLIYEKKPPWKIDIVCILVSFLPLSFCFYICLKNRIIKPV